MTEEVKILFSRLEKLQTDLGTRSTGRTDRFEVPTVWASVAILAGTLDDLQKEILTYPTKEEITSALRIEVGVIEKKALATVNDILNDLESKVKSIILQNESSAKKHKADIE